MRYYEKIKIRQYLLNCASVRRNEVIQWLGGKCDCGSTRNLGLCYDGPRTKAGLPRLLSDPYTRESLDELRKCTVRCASCRTRRSNVMRRSRAVLGKIMGHSSNGQESGPSSR